MRAYNIYSHPVLQRVAVKQGWSWPAALFGPLWFLYKRMVLNFFIMWLFCASVQYLLESTWPTGAVIVPFLLMLGFGFIGNPMYEDHLERGGYELIVYGVEANNPAHALARSAK